MGPPHLASSTSQILTHLNVGRALLVLDGMKGEEDETVLRYETEPEIESADGVHGPGQQPLPKLDDCAAPDPERAPECDDSEWKKTDPTADHPECSKT